LLADLSCHLGTKVGRTFKDPQQIIVLSSYNAPIPQVPGRYDDIHTRGENNLTRTLSLST